LTISGNRLGVDGRRFEEARQAALARDGHRHAVAAGFVSRKEGRQRVLHQLVAVGVGLAEQLGILDVIEGLRDERLTVIVERAAQRLERALTDIDAPKCIALGHALLQIVAIVPVFTLPELSGDCQQI
jgi:hypothetical protein